MTESKSVFLVWIKLSSFTLNKEHFLQSFVLQHSLMPQPRGPQRFTGAHFLPLKQVNFKRGNNAETARYFVLPRKPLLAQLLVMRNRERKTLISSTQEGPCEGAAAWGQLTSHWTHSNAIPKSTLGFSRHL